jgi:hypothetical protein
VTGCPKGLRGTLTFKAGIPNAKPAWRPQKATGPMSPRPAPLFPKNAADIERLAALIEGVNVQSSTIAALVQSDYPHVIGYYNRGLDTGAYASVAAASRKVSAAQADLELVLKTLTNASVDAAAAASADFDATLVRLNVIMLVTGFATIVATTALTLLLGRRMSQRLGRVSNALAKMVRKDFTGLSEALGRLAQGDLRPSFRSNCEPIGDGGSDEIADVARSCDLLVAGLNLTGDDLTAALAKLRTLIPDVVTASRELF